MAGRGGLGRKEGRMICKQEGGPDGMSSGGGEVDKERDGRN